MLSKDGFGENELERVDEICALRGFTRIYPLAPGQKPPHSIILRAVEGDLSQLAGLGLNIEPPTDDSPYFFHVVSPFANPSGLPALAGRDFNRESTSVLRQAMFAVAGLAILLFLSPFLARIDPRQRRGTTSQLARASLFFASIGCSFMLVENVLVQRFVLYLGHPSYATTVIIASLLIGMGLGSIFAENFGISRLKAWGLLALVGH